MHPDEKVRTLPDYRSALASNINRYRVEYRIIRQDGSVRCLDEDHAIVRDENGNAIRTYSAKIDITKRKEAEMVLENAHNELEQRVEKRTAELSEANEQLREEIRERKKAGRILKERERDLEGKGIRLTELNTALNVLLEKRETDKVQMVQNVVQNVQDMIEPLIDNLKNSGLNDRQQGYFEALESFLKEITSPFSGTLKAQYSLLTPSEIRVANLIRQSKTSKEIAQILNSSEIAVKHHRRGIRRKLGLIHKKVNLATYLTHLPK
jgi:DNA-binding CsgD family transcriptional regulator